MVAVLALISAVSLAQPDDRRPLPTIDVVRDALRRNSEAIANRRVKIIMVVVPGPLRVESPPADAPDREEVEQVCASDGRWRERSSQFRRNKLTQVVDCASVGGGTTRLDSYISRQKATHRATVKAKPDGSASGPIDFFSENLHGAFTGQPTLRWADDGEPLLVLEFADSRVPFRFLHLLDPAKNYWPVGAYSENQTKGGARTKSPGTRVEFQNVQGKLFPKRSTTPRRRGGPNSSEFETFYLTVAGAEFPARFDDAEFQIAIPDGADVDDLVSSKRYVKGAPELPATSPPAETPPEPTKPSQELWLIYFCFLLFGTALVGAAHYLISMGSLRWPWRQRP